MLKQTSKVIFWSALAVFFCVILGYSSRALASDQTITINEVFYDTPGADDKEEWIELYNPTNSDVDISGYKLGSNNDGDYSVPDGTIIKPQKYLVIAKDQEGFFNLYGFNPDTFGMKLSLANTGDYVTLYNQNYVLIDAVVWENGTFDGVKSYVKGVTTGHSIERKTGSSDSDDCNVDFVDRFPPTPGTFGVEKTDEIIIEEDEFAEDNQLAIIAISDARKKAAGETVRISGVVTILPGNLSDQYFYVEDTTGGIQIYCYKKDFPNLTLGDLVEVSGETSDYYTDKRVKIGGQNDIIIIGKTELPEVKSITIDEIGDDLVGQIITFEGEVSSTSGSTFYLEGSGEIKINIKDQTNIDKPRMAVGDKVRIIGVVSKYKNTYQVLPLNQAGVTILTSGKLPVGGKKDLDLSKSFLVLSLWKLLPKAKKRLKNLPKTMPKV